MASRNLLASRGTDYYHFVSSSRKQRKERSGITSPDLPAGYNEEYDGESHLQSLPPIAESNQRLSERQYWFRCAYFTVDVINVVVNLWRFGTGCIKRIQLG